jgi:hypothetical protein
MWHVCNPPEGGVSPRGATVRLDCKIPTKRGDSCTFTPSLMEKVYGLLHVVSPSL